MIRREGLWVDSSRALTPTGVRLESQLLQHLIDFLRRIATDNGIAPGFKRLPGSFCECTAPCALHRQIVRKNKARKVQCIAQQSLENAFREGCGNFIVSRIHHVRVMTEASPMPIQV